MKIGELAQLTGTPIETIRFYEQKELLPKATRTAGNYRVYDDAHTERLGFIRHCRSLDMTLDEVRRLLDLRDTPPESCEPVNELLDEHIGHVVRRIKELRSLERQLKELRAKCNAPSDGSACGILSDLAETATKTTLARSRGTHVHGSHG